MQTKTEEDFIMEPKTLLLTGATSGIGLATANMLVAKGHTVLLHGRNESQLEKIAGTLSGISGGGRVESYVADLSSMAEVEALAKAVSEKHEKLDVLINNAGVYGVSASTTQEDLDPRFAVNTIAPYLLTKRLLPLLSPSSRVVNLSSAAQAPVTPEVLTGPSNQSDGIVYAQSKLALTMWTFHMAHSLGNTGPVLIALNPKSMLGSKMVKEAYGVAGHDLNIGAEIICRAAFSEQFADASGHYFDNDIGQFASPHADALNPQKCADLVRTLESILSR